MADFVLESNIYHMSFNLLVNNNNNNNKTY